MKLRKAFVIILLLLLLLAPLFTSPVKAQTTAAGDIAKQLVCQCGCTSILSNCTHIECMSRNGMTALIEQKLAQGQSGEQIIQFFVDQYGEQVLSEPPKRGFNLVAWVLPFVAILVAGAVIYLALRKWVKQGSQPQTTAIPETEEEKEKYQQRLEKELKEFTEESFR